VKPGLEPIRVAETGQVAPGADECFLDRVARELRVPKDEASGRVQPREAPIDKVGEGVMIAPLRSFDKTVLVNATPRLTARPRRPYSTGYGAGVSE